MTATPRPTSSTGAQPPTRVPLARRFTHRYILAVLLFAAMMIGTKVTLDLSGRRVSQLTRQLRAVSEQTQRVDDVVDLASRVTFQPSPPQPFQIDTWATRLRSQADLLRQVEDGLVVGDATLDLPATDLDAAQTGLHTGPDRLQPLIHQMSEAADRLVDRKNATQDERAAELATITSAHDAVQTGLDKALDIYGDAAQAQLDDQSQRTDLILVIDAIVLLGIVVLIFRPMARSIHSETDQLERAERMQRESNERQTFRADLVQALEVTDTEHEVLAAVGRALGNVVPEHPAELLLADASYSHLREGQVNPLAGGPGCPVDSPMGCAAIRRGHSVVYESSRDLNVCPKLPEHQGGACSAVCVPVMFMGKALGVVHVTGPEHAPPEPREAERLAVLAAETGNRLGLMRNTHATELAASTDGLTGLLNRRTLEGRARTLMLDDEPFSVAMADLDRFKRLNDRHGHESGDRALRTFASVLKACLRPEDVIARYGGEEFVVLLPHTPLPDALRALQRLQSALEDELAANGGVRFSASWGLTDRSAGASFDEIVAVADAAMYEAKRQGRDCIMVDGVAAGRAGMPVPEEARTRRRRSAPPGIVEPPSLGLDELVQADLPAATD